MLVQKSTKIVSFHFSLLKLSFLSKRQQSMIFSPHFHLSRFFSKLNIRFNTSIWPNISPYQFEFGNSLLIISHPTFIHSITQSLLHSFFHSLIHSSVHILQLTHPLSHLLTHLLANSCTNIIIHCFTYISHI